MQHHLSAVITLAPAKEKAGDKHILNLAYSVSRHFQTSAGWSMGAMDTGCGSSSTDTYLGLSGSCNCISWRISFSCVFMGFVSVFHSIACLRSGKVIGYKRQLELVGANPVPGLLNAHVVTELGCPGLHLYWFFSVQLEVVKSLK